MTGTIGGILPSQAPSAYGAIDPPFWTATAFMFLPNNIPGIGAGERAPMRRLMTCLGADNYRNVFVLAGKNLNAAKGRIWGYLEPEPEDDMKDLLGNPNSIQDLMNMIRYVRTELRRSLTLYYFPALKAFY